MREMTVRETHWFHGYTGTARGFARAASAIKLASVARRREIEIGVLHACRTELAKHVGPTSFYDGGTVDAALDAFN